MKPPFDIAADLDTPVSAYLKLAALKPRFLLESVEGGERLARFSFLGFGDALEVRLDDDGLRVGSDVCERPQNQDEYLDALRVALKRAPLPQPQIEGLPFCGGLVGVSGYDVVRLFEKLPRTAKPQAGIPDAAFCATTSTLVFDHLTRRFPAAVSAGKRRGRRKTGAIFLPRFWRCARGASRRRRIEGWK